VLIDNTMTDGRSHRHAHTHARAAAPTLSLLRLSAAQRLAGAGVVLGLLWLAVLATVA
jgi:hypothetical protein